MEKLILNYLGFFKYIPFIATNPFTLMIFDAPGSTECLSPYLILFSGWICGPARIISAPILSSRIHNKIIFAHLLTFYGAFLLESLNK